MRISETPIEREYTATNCLTGQAEYLTDYGTDRRYLMNVGMASSALPGATPAVVINGIPYADGGVADSISVRRAFARGCDKVVIVETRRREFRMQLSKGTKFLAKRNERNILPLRRQCAIAPNDIMRRLILFTRWKRQAGSLSSALSSLRSSVWRRIIRS